jgi:pilus assembly protein Flp/PilA
LKKTRGLPAGGEPTGQQGIGPTPSDFLQGAGTPVRTSRVNQEHTMQLINIVKKFVKDEEGVTAIEYGLIAALIAVVIIGAVTNVGTALVGIFGQIAAAL